MTEPHGRIISGNFEPPRWLRSGHAQTVLPSLPWAWRGELSLRREILELPDGDATTVDWAGDSCPEDSETPLLIILHGLESSSDSPYARMMLSSALAHGWHACVLHFRDCGDYRNRLPRRYHAGETGDVRFFLDSLAAGSARPLFVVGYSLGGNVLLKYLGESGDDTPVSAASAVCVPLDLQACATSLNGGISKIYQYHLIKNMKKSVRRKFTPDTDAFDWRLAMQAKTFDQFDDAVTAPLHGFRGKDEYYGTCSSIRFLGRIRKPTLILNAVDDPFMSPDMIPDATALPPAVTLELSPGGGHVGFINGGTPWRPRYYIPGRVLQYFEPHTD